MTYRVGSLALIASVLAVAPLAAQNVIVTSPPVKTVVAGDQSDPFALDTWLRDNVRTGSSVGVDGTYAHDGNGSAFMQGLVSNTSKADMEYYFGGSIISPFTLSQLSSVSYNYYRDASSTANANLAPSMRLVIDNDGNLATTNDLSYLIFEPVYNGVTTVPTNAWQTGTIAAGTNIWWQQVGVGPVTEYNLTLADFVSGETRNGRTINGNSLVLGVSSGIGSGWTGTYTGAIDDVRIQYTGANATAHNVNFNFEVAGATTSTPEPGSIALVATGLFGLGGVALKRRRRNS